MTTLVPSFLDESFFVLTGNKDIHKSLNEFELCHCFK